MSFRLDLGHGKGPWRRPMVEQGCGRNSELNKKTNSSDLFQSFQSTNLVFHKSQFSVRSRLGGPRCHIPYADHKGNDIRQKTSIFQTSWHPPPALGGAFLADAIVDCSSSYVSRLVICVPSVERGRSFACKLVEYAPALPKHMRTFRKHAPLLGVLSEAVYWQHTKRECAVDNCPDDTYSLASFTSSFWKIVVSRWLRIEQAGVACKVLTADKLTSVFKYT